MITESYGEIETAQRDAATAVHSRLMYGDPPPPKPIALRRSRNVIERKPLPTITIRPGIKDTSINTPSVRWREIMQQVSEKHKLSIQELTSRRRSRPVVTARHELWWRLKTETRMSLPEIGRKTGGFDHSSVHHAIQSSKHWSAE